MLTDYIEQYYEIYPDYKRQLNQERMAAIYELMEPDIDGPVNAEPESTSFAPVKPDEWTQDFWFVEPELTEIEQTYLIWGANDLL